MKDEVDALVVNECRHHVQPSPGGEDAARSDEMLNRSANSARVNTLALVGVAHFGRPIILLGGYGLRTVGVDHDRHAASNRTALAIVSAASRCIPGITCEYRCRVNSGEA